MEQGNFRIWVSTLALLCASGCATAPYQPPAPIEPLDYLSALKGSYFPLKSTVMGGTYHIYIRYPESYEANPSRRYPIVYLLDGDSLFPMLAPQHLFLTYDDHLPEAIIVGIAYGSFQPPINHREADFGRRADDFQQFLAAELLPSVESRARADINKRILVGQSFGGDFVLYSALTSPDLFWARISSNPSFRLHEARYWEAAASASRRDLRVVLVSGTANQKKAREEAIKWGRSWQARQGPWAVDQIDLPAGTHAADIGNAYRAALRRLFSTVATESRS